MHNSVDEKLNEGGFNCYQVNTDSCVRIAWHGSSSWQ